MLCKYYLALETQTSDSDIVPPTPTKDTDSTPLKGKRKAKEPAFNFEDNVFKDLWDWLAEHPELYLIESPEYSRVSDTEKEAIWATRADIVGCTSKFVNFIIINKTCNKLIFLCHAHR